MSDSEENVLKVGDKVSGDCIYSAGSGGLGWDGWRRTGWWPGKD